MKNLFLIIFVAASFIACKGNRNDKVVDDNVKLMAQSMLDTTTVELIDSVFNFGKITEGEKVTFNYRFKNSGTKPLVITNTTASCGCTVPEKPEKPILPGEEGFIKVVFNSSGKVGHNLKHINVIANTKPEFPVLQLTGDVIKAN